MSTGMSVDTNFLHNEQIHQFYKTTTIREAKQSEILLFFNAVSVIEIIFV